MTPPFPRRPRSRAVRLWPLAAAATLLAVPAGAAAVAPGGSGAPAPHPVVRAAAAGSTATTAATTAANADPCPPPGNIGTIVDAEYNGVPPSVQDDRLVGPTLLVKAARVDPACNGPVTLPLYEGRMRDGTPVWYVLTETDDQANARALGINFSSKLTYADSPSTSDSRGGDKDRDAVRNAVQSADGTLVFDCGAVDFSPVRRVEGTAFPPTVAEPGSRGDSCYTPLVKVRNAGGHVYNAPVVAYGTSAEQLSAYCTGAPDYAKVHDKVLHICPEAQGGGTTGGTVTLKRTVGFSFARPVVYLSFESNDPVGATLEAATLTPRLGRLGRGRDDSAFSAVERLFTFANGPTGGDNPQRQGLTSAIRGEGDPLNTFGGIPTLALDYSPLWDLQIGEWTKTAIDRGYRSRETEEFAILSLVKQGYITGPGGRPYGSSGVIVNCPVIARLL